MTTASRPSRWGSGFVLRVGFACALLLALWARPAQADLRTAYQRELAFLEAEKHSLTQRLEQLERDSEQALEQARADVERLQGQALSLSLEADRRMEILSDIEREVDRGAEEEDLIGALLSQAAVALEKGRIELPPAVADDPESELGQVRFAFDRSIGLLPRFSRLRQEPGEFFAESGEKVSGQLLHLGQVASFGVSDRFAGALAPAGEGRLKLWPGVHSAKAARALSAGEPPARLPLFLYESLEKGVEKREEKTALQVIESGGVIGWVIVVLGVIAALLALTRTLSLAKAAANTGKLLEQITPLVERKDFDAAIALCKQARSAGGRVLVATLTNLHRPRPELEDIVSEAVLHEQPTLDRFGSLLTVIAAVAPLLGLLGTVTGMIATFDIITEFGTGNPKLLSSGIAIALVTTELGLIVAIPTLVIATMLSSWADGIRDDMDKTALRVVNIGAGVRLTERPSTVPELGPPREAIAVS